MTQKTPLCPMRPCYRIVLGVDLSCGKNTSLDCKDGTQLKGFTLLPKREKEFNIHTTQVYQQGERKGCGVSRGYNSDERLVGLGDTQYDTQRLEK